MMKDNFKKWFKSSWSYLTGAILLALIQAITLIVTKEPFGITSAFSYWANEFAKWLGIKINGISDPLIETLVSPRIFIEAVTLRNLGIIVGALLAVLLAEQFRLKKIKSKKQVVGAVLGGLFMGYGSSIAFGCNIGAFFSGIASLSLSGWVFGLFLFLGAIIGGKIILHFFL
ncbi:YeeE/YedE thiosulfate transporter family protein [Eubacteriaceae bacterium ES2]|nr:YeeE/YedE thiosulfate transporter family protein [Eubacteriaceae bacterium ES2]